MDEQRKPEDRAERQEAPQAHEDKPRGETEQRPKDLDPKDQGKDVRGGGKWSR